MNSYGTPIRHVIVAWFAFMTPIALFRALFLASVADISPRPVPLRDPWLRDLWRFIRGKSALFSVGRYQEDRFFRVGLGILVIWAPGMRSGSFQGSIAEDFYGMAAFFPSFGCFFPKRLLCTGLPDPAVITRGGSGGQR